MSTGNSNATSLQGNAVAAGPASRGQSYVYDAESSSLKLQAKINVDVRDWGVKCDGTTDDSPALQAMFDSIRSTKWTGRLVFPVIPEPPVTWSGNPAMCSLSSTVTVKGDQLTILAWGTLFRCRMNAVCFMIGDTSNQNDSRDITWYGGKFAASYNTPTTNNPIFRDNAQGTRFVGASGMAPNGHYELGYGQASAFIENWDDEKQVIDSINADGVVRCDATFCGAAIYAPGPFSGPTRAGITTVTNSTLAGSCANGIDWHSGNDLYIGPGNIIQGVGQFAIRVDVSNGYANKLVVNDVYQEVGSCTNKYYSGQTTGIGVAGIIVQGPYTVTKHGGTGGGKISYFWNNGTHKHVFYVVANNGTNDSVALPLGYAMSDNTTLGTVSWPRITGAKSYKLLATRPSGSEEYVPYAGVNSLVGTVTDATCASNGTYCSLSYDPAAALGAYSVPQLYSVNYIPILNFWPAPIVLGPGSNGYGGSGSAPGVLETDSMENPVVTARAWYKPFAWNTTRFENGADQTPVPNQIAYQRPMYMTSPEPGFILNGTMEPVQSSDLGRKGKLNFGGYSWGSTSITDLITCRDSAFLKTMAHVQLRPTNDAADCALGVMGPNIGYLRAQSKWRFYFNAVPASTSDTNAIELSATGINLPSGSTYKIDGKPVTTASSFAFSPTVVSRNTCSDQAVTVKGITTSNKLSEVTPPAPWGNVSVQVYPSASDTLTFHFCNGTESNATPPSGTYSIIAF